MTHYFCFGKVMSISVFYFHIYEPPLKSITFMFLLQVEGYGFLLVDRQSYVSRLLLLE